MTSETPAVVAGLTVGIALIVVFSLAFGSTIALSEGKAIRTATQTAEVQTFKERYPSASEEIWRDGTDVYVVYVATKTQPDETGKGKFILTVGVGEMGATSMELECAGYTMGVYYTIFHPTLDNIMQDGCLERN
jgi:hypothetical protein